MSDPILRAFLRTAAEDAARVNAESDAVRLVSCFDRGAEPPDTWLGLIEGVEHLERHPDGVRTSAEPIPFGLRFPRDYCSSLDPNLQFRVAQIRTEHPFFHPNVRGSLVCLGRECEAGRFGVIQVRVVRKIEHLHSGYLFEVNGDGRSALHDSIPVLALWVPRFVHCLEFRIPGLVRECRRHCR